MHGGKADNLVILDHAGLPVPTFYTIDAKVLRHLDDAEKAETLKSELAAWKASHDIKSVAVRSSSVGEDGSTQSFAGQFNSVMDIKNDDEFVTALRQVAKSQPKEGYQKSIAKHQVHVIVQEYIEPDAAGVLFTVNPANGQLEFVINAVRGHGGAVVDGEAAEKIYVDRLDDTIRTGARELLMPESQLRELVRLTLKIERLMGVPQDIEWAIKDGVVFILQTRPITHIAHLRVWDNANIGESFPGIVLPLTFSVARRGYELVYQSQGVGAGLDWYALQENSRTFHDMVGLFSGRMYYNLANWYRFIGLFPGNGQNQKYLDDQLQTVGEAVYVPPSSYPLGYRLRFYANVARRTLFFELMIRRYWRQLQSTYERYETLPQKGDLSLLLDNYTFIEQRVVPHMGRSADNDFLVMAYHGILKRKMGQWFGADKSSTTNFLGALHDVVSARQAVVLMDIATVIQRDQTALTYLEAGNFEALDAYLLKHDAGQLLNEYRTTFLHRFAEDQKLESVNLMLTLEGFYGMIAAYVKRQTNEKTDRHEQALAHEQDLQQKLLAGLTLPQRIIYKILISRLKHHLRIREHNRLLRGKAYAYLRELFITIGAQLAADAIVDTAGDVHYLDIEELLRIVNGTGYQDDIRMLIVERKKRYEQYRAITPPARFITTKPGEEPREIKSSVGPSIDQLKGTISSPGDIEGIVLVLDTPIIPDEPFDILVVSHTDPGWTPLIALARGLVIEHGGILSHAAIVTRELGIPSIIGVDGATTILKTGMRVRINTAAEQVEIIE
jgi:rifampicin phosphotransferase